MRTTIPRPAHDEWLELRHHYWNASEASVLVGLHPFATLADVAVRKITKAVDEPNRAMTRGIYLEAPIAEWWSQEHGIAVYEPDELYVFDDVMATLDRRLVGSSTDLLEIKTTSQHVHGVGLSWWWQGQAQLLATGAERVHFAIVDGSMDLQSYEVEKDLDAMAEIAERASKVMAFIRRGEMPPEAELSYKHHEALHPRPVGGTVDLDDDTAEAVAELVRIRSERRAIEALEEEVKTVIAAALGDASGGVWEGREIVTWRSVTRTGLDSGRLRRELPEIHRQFVTETSYRMMRTIGR
jgi:predicted phage-related endonuclease